MLLDCACIDAITISSHDVELSDYWSSAVRNFSQLDRSGIKSTGFKGYNGHVSRDGHIAFFHRDGDGSTDYLVQLRGPDSEVRFHSVGLTKPFRITRVDVAYTSSKPYPRLSSLVSSLDMVSKKLKLEKDADGLETLYVGKRTSTKFCRFYEKPTHDGLRLRFEVELKGEYAHKYGPSIIESSTARYAVLAGILDWLPLEVKGQLPFDFTYNEQVSPRKYVLERGEPDKGLTYDIWVANTVVPSLKRRMMLESELSDDGYDFSVKYEQIINDLSVSLECARENYKRLHRDASVPCCYDAPTDMNGRRIKNPFRTGFRKIEGYD